MSATDGENFEKVAKLLNDDRRYTCTEIAHELDISHGSAHSILTERLEMRKVAARRVPHMLSDSEKTPSGKNRSLTPAQVWGRRR